MIAPPFADSGDLLYQVSPGVKQKVASITSATMYASSPAISVAVIPQKIVTATASTEAITEEAPLIARYHAAGADVLRLTCSIPRGKAIPIRNPIGTSALAATPILTGMEAWMA
jgi:hypothetical protein